MSSTKTIAKLFWTGRSQAVRLPEAFRFKGDAVQIRRQGEGVILEPLAPAADDWGWLDAFDEPLDDDFVQAALADVPPQDRPLLDDM